MGRSLWRGVLWEVRQRGGASLNLATSFCDAFIMTIISLLLKASHNVNYLTTSSKSFTLKNSDVLNKLT